jgi:hypothetical protein
VVLTIDPGRGSIAFPLLVRHPHGYRRLSYLKGPSLPASAVMVTALRPLTVSPACYWPGDHASPGGSVVAMLIAAQVP